jgi:hypothetical protein
MKNLPNLLKPPIGGFGGFIRKASADTISYIA